MCRNCASTHNDSDVHQENACDMTTCTQIPDKSDDGDEDAVEEETDSETDKNSPQTYNMTDWSETKAYERRPVITTLCMSDEDNEGEGDEDDKKEWSIRSSSNNKAWEAPRWVSVCCLYTASQGKPTSSKL